MKIGIYEGVDELVTAILRKTQKNDLNNFLAESFPQLFSFKNTFLQHLHTIPLPIRDKFVFVLLYGQSNTGIPLLDKEIILAFGMLDCSNLRNNDPPILKNFCRKKGVEWKGVGKHVLKAFDNYGSINGIEVLGLKAENDNLINYYKKFGWQLRNDIHKNFMIKVL